MAIVAIVIVAVLAFVIAAAVIGREARRLGTQRLEPVYRLPEAVGSIANGLDAESASALTSDDVTEVVRLHLNLLQFEGPPDADTAVAGSVVDAEDAVQTIYRRAREGGLDVSRPHVEVIMDGHMNYLRAIGAIGDVE